MSNAAYESGLVAFQNDETTDQCAYPTGSDQGRDWMRGWTEGQSAERAKDKPDDLAAD